MGFILIAIILALAYLLLQLFYLYHWVKTPEVDIPDEYIPSTAFTVVVVARNEEKSIEQCIRGILKQSYPQQLFEIIVIDDRSTDGTAEIIKNIDSSNLRFFRLSDFAEIIHPPAYKKSAIELAVQQARHDWIVLTDADCIHSSQWLRTLAYAQNLTDAVFLAAPLRYVHHNSLLEKMQDMEMQVFMLITAAGIRSGLHDMANGANMTFSKSAFLEVGGYKGNYQYASGDDMFLIEKMRSAFPTKISFVKSVGAVVETNAHHDWDSLLKQRIRWAGKNKGLKSPVISIIWVFIGFYNMMILVTLFTALLLTSMWWPFALMILIKWISDWMLIRIAGRFFMEKFHFIDLPSLQVMYMLYIFRLGLKLIRGEKSDW